MSKKKKHNQDAFEEELLKEFLEDGSTPEVLPVEAVLESPKEVQNGSELVRMKVTVVRAYIFTHPDLRSRSLTAVSFGNLLNLLDEGDEDSRFFKVRVPRSGSPVEGFILKTKVKKI